MMRRILGWLSTVAVVAVVAAWFVFLRPGSLGGPVDYVVIRGTSMLPAYQTGDLVIVRAQPYYTVGDVVAYRVPDGEVGAGHLVIHRLVRWQGDGWLVQGDNNDATDPWTPSDSDIAGAAWWHVPGVGRALAVMHQPAVLGALAAALAVMAMVSRRPPGEGQSRSGSRSATKTRTRPVRPETAASSRSRS